VSWAGVGVIGQNVCKVSTDFFACIRSASHERRTIAIDDLWCLSVCLSRGFAVRKRTAERIDVLFGMKALVGPRHTLLDGGPIPTAMGSLEKAFEAAFAKLLLLLVVSGAGRNKIVDNYSKVRPLCSNKRINDYLSRKNVAPI